MPNGTPHLYPNHQKPSTLKPTSTTTIKNIPKTINPTEKPNNSQPRKDSTQTPPKMIQTIKVLTIATLFTLATVINFCLIVIFLAFDEISPIPTILLFIASLSLSILIRISTIRWLSATKMLANFIAPLPTLFAATTTLSIWIFQSNILATLAMIIAFGLTTILGLRMISRSNS